MNPIVKHIAKDILRTNVRPLSYYVFNSDKLIDKKEYMVYFGIGIKENHWVGHTDEIGRINKYSEMLGITPTEELVDYIIEAYYYVIRDCQDLYLKAFILYSQQQIIINCDKFIKKTTL
jgi:hypothetical protein